MKTLLTALPAILAGLLCSCGSMYGDLADESTGDVTGLWRSVDSMPTARAVPSLAELNGKVYAAGGIIGGKCTNAFETYDLRTGKWSVLKPNTAGATWMGKRKWAGCCAYNGRIYVAGGFGTLDESSDAYAVLSSLRIYDPATNTWSDGPELLAPGHIVSTAVLNGTIYAAISGRSSIYCFDVTHGTSWPAYGIACPGPAFDNPMVQAIGDKLFFADLSSTNVYAYTFDPTKGAGCWTQAKTYLLSEISTLSSAVVNGKFCLTGTFSGRVSTVLIDPASVTASMAGTWIEGPGFPSTTEQLSAFGFGSSLFLFGGSSGTAYYDSVYSYFDPAL